MTKLTLVLCAFIAFIVILVHVVLADVPQLINFQGTLHDNAGNPLTGQYEITFRIYNVESGGSYLWTETNNVDCDDGLYHVILGQTSSLNLDFDGQYWLGVHVTGDTELSPRYHLVSVPYAFRARVADQVTWAGLTDVPEGFADGIDDVGETGVISQISAGPGIIVENPVGPTTTVAADIGYGVGKVASGDHNHHEEYVNEGQANSITSNMIVDGTIQEEDLSFPGSSDSDWTIDGDDIYRTTGNVGIGVTSPAYPLHIKKTSTDSWIAGIHNQGPGAGDHGLVVRADGGDPLLVQSGGKNILNAKQSGYVGIGTTNPRTDFEVMGTSGIRVTTGQHSNVFGEIKHGYSNGLIINANAGGGWADIRFQADGNDRMFIERAGNVGIGTTNPETKLHIDGGSDASLGGGGFLMTGSAGGTNMVLDNNEIIARNNGNPSKLYLNKESGNVVVNVLEITGGSDLAEPFEVAGAESIEAGMVVAIDPEQPGQLRIADKAYDRTVAGIVSGAGGIKPGMLMGQKGSVASGANPVALTGRVYCLADAAYGAIQPGDLLTSSHTPGHAMKVTDYSKAHGAILGKAMSSLDHGQGLVLVLVTLQ